MVIGRKGFSSTTAAVSAYDDSDSEPDFSLPNPSSWSYAKRIRGNEALLDWSRRESERSSKLVAKISSPSSSSDGEGAATLGLGSLGERGCSYGAASSSQQP